MGLSTSDFSLIVPPYGVAPPSPSELIDLALHAEALGYYSVGLPHVPSLPHAPERGPEHVASFVAAEFRDFQYDALVLVPMISYATTRIRVGFNVLVTPWLHPYVWAKYLASLDAASSGRLVAGFGLGFAMPNRPAKSLQSVGIDSTKRGRMADESLELIRELWSSTEPISFEGKFFQGTGMVVVPKSVRQPHPEVWWAGNATPSIARAARHARYLELSFPTPQELELKSGALHLENLRIGSQCAIAAQVNAMITDGSVSREASVRDLYGASTRLSSFVVGTPMECAATITAMRQAGAAHYVLSFNRGGRDGLDTYHRQIELFATEVLPILRELPDLGDAPTTASAVHLEGRERSDA